MCEFSQNLILAKGSLERGGGDRMRNIEILTHSKTVLKDGKCECRGSLAFAAALGWNVVFVSLN